MAAVPGNEKGFWLQGGGIALVMPVVEEVAP